jgi:hypothetical protein
MFTFIAITNKTNSFLFTTYSFIFIASLSHILDINYSINHVEYQDRLIINLWRFDKPSAKLAVMGAVFNAKIAYFMSLWQKNSNLECLISNCKVLIKLDLQLKGAIMGVCGIRLASGLHKQMCLNGKCPF